MKWKLIIPVVTILNLVAIGILTTGFIKDRETGPSTRFTDNDIVEVFHDQGHVFMQPLEPSREDDITFRIRTYRGNVKEAQIRYTFDYEEDDPAYQTANMAFEGVDETGYYEYWVGIVPKQNNPFKYYFKLENDQEFIHYNANGFSDPNEDFNSSNGHFLVKPGFQTPDWSKGAIWYSIMPDSFYNGDPLNDKYTQEGVFQNPWGNSHFHGNDYFGGDLKGIEKQLDYLDSLGVSSLQLNPIWISTHQAGYGAFDFTQIDSAFGNNDTLHDLSSLMHDRDMYITLDGVFKYFNENGVWYNRYNRYPLAGAVNPRDPYYQIYMRDDYNNIIRSWGSPEIDFSNKLARELIYTTDESVLQLYYDDFAIDGFRLDVGESLRGSDPDNWGDADQIIKDMRRYIKALDEDNLLMSEHGSGDLIFDYTLDTKWNYGFGWPVRDWAAGISNNVVLNSRLVEEINRMPRPIANASYNFLTTHDESRIFNYVDGDVYAMNAANLLQMTYIGAPSIYFGDEIGMISNANPGVSDKAPTSFDSFNWDTSEWNYEVFHYFMMLSQLRQDYEKVFKDGVYVSLLVDSDILAYGRWNEGGKVITAVNNSDQVIEDVKLEARQLSIPDGTKLTDYLSGNVYTVVDGYVTIDVMPGGAALVDGDITSDYIGMFKTNDYGQLTRQNVRDYTTFGRGTVEDGLNSWMPVFNNGYIDFTYKENRSGSGFAGFEDVYNETLYGIVVADDGTVSIQYRDKGDSALSEGHELNISDGDRLRIMRHDNNRFGVYIMEDDMWTPVSNQLEYVNMNYEIRAGFQAISEEFTFHDVNIESTSNQLADDFNQGLGNMIIQNGLTYTIDNQRLEVESTEDPIMIDVQAPYGDWTFKSAFETTLNDEGSYAGIKVLQDENHYIVGGRLHLDGADHIFIGQVVDGELMVYETKETVATQITVQLEKQGSNYRLTYDEGNGWESLDATITANYSRLITGTIIENGTLSMEYISFGDSINDSGSYGNHQYIGELDLTLEENGFVFNRQSYEVDNGEWVYDVGGFRQTDVDISQHKLNYTSALFNNHKSEFTWEIHDMDEQGSLIYRFGFDDFSTDESIGYVLKLDADGLVSLIYNDETIDTANLESFSLPSNHRFVIDVSNDMIRIYHGQDSTPLFSVEDTAFGPTRMQMIGNQVDYTLVSPNVFHHAPNWLIGKGSISGVDGELSLRIQNNETPYHYSYIANNAVSDFMFAANVKYEKASILRSEFGMVIGGDVGSHPLHTGLMLGVNDFNQLYLKENNEILTTADLDEDVNIQSFYLLVIVQDGEIRVYIDESLEPTLVYDAEKALGGTLGFYSDSANVSLKYVHLEGLEPTQDYTQLDGYQTRTIDDPPPPNPSVSDSMATEDIYIDLDDPQSLAVLNRYSGNWKIEDNQLIAISGSGNWTGGATFAAGKYADFELSYAIRIDEGAFGGALIRKNNFNDNHEVSGMLLYKNMGNGGVVGYFGSEIIPVSTIPIDEDGFAHITIRAVGSTLEVSAGDGTTYETFTYDMDDATRVIADEGYVSLISGNSVSIFKDISIRILDNQGNYINP